MPRPVPERQELPIPRSQDARINNWGVMLVRTLVNVLSQVGRRVNGSIHQDGEIRMQAPFKLKSYLAADLPDASEWEGSIVYVSDGSAGAKFRGSDGSSWVFLDATGGGTTLVSGTRWRVYVDENNGGANCTIAELKFYDTNGQQFDTSTVASASASTQANTSNSADKAFDADTSTKWTSGASTGDEWVEYEFPTGAAVAKILMTGQYSGGGQAALAPQDFRLQVHDGSDWVDVGDPVTGETGWGAAEEREFEFQP